MNKVEIVADSKNTFGQRITSMVVTFPRFLLAEINTHRALSRNSASSRAIRFDKMVESVMTNPFIPMKWQKDHAGMQGTEYFTEPAASAHKGVWLRARDEAVDYATALNKGGGVTKQLCNRLLEPFMYHTALITATEWENFFALRVSEHAEIHFQDIAEKMLQAMNESEPKQLQPGEWHIPFGDTFKLFGTFTEKFDYSDKDLEMLRVKLATVRCARISYLNQGKEASIEDDLKLHDRLASSGHWSAFEHCAQAMTEEDFEMYMSGNTGNYNPKTFSAIIAEDNKGWCGNFRGFIQYRKMFTDENRQDSRLIKK